jgi:DNA-binding transcriptional LysR family regulator
VDRLTEFETFLRVAESASFTAAARALSLTPSAVSKHIKALEERLGARLFQRTTRSVTVTEVGAAFRERIEGVMDEIAEAEQAVAQLQEEPRGTLRVGAPMDFGRTFLGAAIAAFAAQHPDLSVEISLSDRYVDVIDEGLDVVVRIGALRDSSLVARRLGPCRRVLCASPRYLERSGRPGQPSDLSGHHRIAYAYESEHSFEFAGDDGPERIRLPVRHRSNNGEMTRQLLLAGEGIALLPTFLVGDDLRSGRLEVVLPESFNDEIGIHALYPHRKHLSAKVRLFVDHLASQCGNEPPWDEGIALARAL